MVFLSGGLDAEAAPPPVSPEVKEGVSAYNRGDYKTAVIKLSGALSTEFNNAAVHYYLANAFVHLKQTESAIREFRIAYALQPDAEVGKFSKEALTYLGVETDGSKKLSEEQPKVKKPPEPKPDPVLEKAISSLRQQTYFAKSYENRANEFLTQDAERRSRQHLDKTRAEILRDNPHFRHGRVQPQLPLDSQRMLDSLRAQFESHTRARSRNNTQRVDDLQQSADNLENLLNEKTPRGGTKLKPTGTNLYIRNYEHDPLKRQGDH